MVATIKHKYTSAVADGGDTSLVQPSNWNDTHDLTGTIPLANGGTNADLSATGPGFLKQASSGSPVTIALPTATDVGLVNVDNTSDASKTATLVAAAHTWALTQTYTLAPVYTDVAGTRTALGLAAVAASGSASDLGSGTLPNGRLVAIPNSALANSAITVNGTSVSLGGSISKGWITLKKVTTDQTTANTAAKVTSWSVTIPANTLGLNGALRFVGTFKFVGTNGTKQVGVDFGGTTLWSSNAGGGATSIGFAIPLTTICNRNSASSQIGALTGTNALAGGTIPATSSIDTTQDQTLTFWITLGSASDTGVLQAGLVEYNNDNP